MAYHDYDVESESEIQNSSGSSIGGISSAETADTFPPHHNILTDIPKGIRILSWNINSVLGHREQLLFLLNTHHYDIFLLQESRLNHKNHFQLHIPGYKKYIKYADIDRNSAGGLVTLVKEEFGSQKYEHAKYGNLFEHLTVCVRTREGILEIQNIYWPNVNPQISRLDSLCKTNPHAQKLIIAGDFNAHQENLISRMSRENANQKKLKSILENQRRSSCT